MIGDPGSELRGWIQGEIERVSKRLLAGMQAPVAAQQDGTPTSDGHRTFNFTGAGVTVSDDPIERRIQVNIPGAPIATSTTTINSAAGAGKMFQLGTEPSGWQNPGFSDASWSASVDETQPQPFVAYTGSAWIAPVNVFVGGFDIFLHRLSFSLPAGTISTATLKVQANDLDRGVWINGTLVFSDSTPATATAGEGSGPQTLTISPSLLTPGATNLLAVKIQNDNASSEAYAVDYQLTVSYSGAAADTRYELVANRGVANGYAELDSSGLIPKGELGTGTPSGSNFLRGDGTWAAASTNSIIIEELDGTPSVAAIALKLPNGTLTDNGDGSVTYTPSLTNEPYVNIQDQKTQNTSGGTFTSGAWQRRDLNTKLSDTGSIATLSSNQISLPAGTYRCRIECPAQQVDGHQARLRNITDSTTLLTGTSMYSPSSGQFGQAPSAITGTFTLSGSKTLEVQHECVTTKATNGFGAAINLATEIYTVAEFWKLS